MKIFIDTANLNEIKEAASFGILDGVTTNPSLMAKEGHKDARKCYEEICKIVPGPVSAEVISTDYEGIIKEGRELAKIAPNIYVKVPLIMEGLKAVKHFQKKASIRTLRCVSHLHRLFWLQSWSFDYKSVHRKA